MHATANTTTPPLPSLGRVTSMEKPPVNLLEAKNLRKCFDELVAVDDVSFHVDAGEVFGLLGPNGAGKSTTMMMLAGLLTPDAGSVQLRGEPLDADSRQLRTLLGVVPQDLALYPDLTAFENLEFFGSLYGIERRELHQRIDEALERIGLTKRAKSRTGTFSGGMKRRLNFGIALLHQPRLLILDEPTVGVDPQSRAHLLECVRQLSEEGVATLYASHYMEEVQAICERVAIMDHGKIVACDEIRTLLGGLSADLRLLISTPPTELAKRLEGLAELQEPINGRDEATIIVSRDQHQDEATLNTTLMKVVAILDELQIPLHSVETHEPNLERLFLQMTGSKLRD